MKFKFKIIVFAFIIHLLVILFCEAGEIYIDRQIKPKVIELINNAKRSIDIEMFILSDRDVIKALRKASSRGIRVRIILDPHRRENHYTFDKFLDSAIEVKFYRIKRPAIFHRKFILFDNKILFIGSTNLSYNGLENNKEIMVEIENKELINSALKIFKDDLY